MNALNYILKINLILKLANDTSMKRYIYKKSQKKKEYIETQNL